MKYFFAGTETRNYAKLLKELGVQNILQSAFYLGPKRVPNEYEFPGYLLDSGGYTFRKNGISPDVAGYAEYINRHDVKTAFNLDTASMQESIANQKHLELWTKAKILPVYHYSDWCDPQWRHLIDDWSRQYDYISIAASAAPGRVVRRQFYEHCFSVVRDRCKVHGLAATGIDDCIDFPFYSVDSTTWLNAEKFGEWHECVEGRIMKHKSLRVQSKSPNPTVTNVNLIDHNGRDFMVASIHAYLEFEAECTRRWAHRGVVFNE